MTITITIIWQQSASLPYLSAVLVTLDLRGSCAWRLRSFHRISRSEGWRLGCSARLFLNYGGCTGFGDVAEDFHDCSEAVAVGHHQHSLPWFYARDDGIVPEGKDAVDGSLQTFSPGKFLRLEVAISLIVAGMPRIVCLKFRRRNIVAPSPNLHLVLTVFLHGF